MNYEKWFQDCYVRLFGGKLTVGNAAVERVWDMTGARPEVLSLKDQRTGREWAATEERGQWVEFPPERKGAFFRASLTHGQMHLDGCEANEDDDFGTGVRHLRVTVRLTLPAKWSGSIWSIPFSPCCGAFLE